MNPKSILIRWLPPALFILLSIFYIWGIPLVPFHPDETTYLYQSTDTETLFQDPLSLAWQPSADLDPLLRYRLLDAPLHRYLFGLTWLVSGRTSESLPNDWNWSESWEVNLTNNALPDPKLLFNARFASTLAVLAAIVLIFQTAKNFGGRWAGLAAALAFGLNGLTLLHGRRVMAEGVLMLAVALALWSIQDAHKRPWLAGLVFAAAACTKYSAAVLFPVGAMAVVWFPGGLKARLKKGFANLLIYTAIFGLFCALLHPALWRHPVQGLGKMLEMRVEFSLTQSEVLAETAPDMRLTTPTQRTASLLAHLFLVPPAVEDFGNYSEFTGPQAEEYFSVPGHNALRGILPGILTLVLILFGTINTARQFKNFDNPKRRVLVLLTAAALIQTAALWAAVGTPIQRYYLPLLPMAAIFAGLAFVSFQKTPNV